MNSIEIRNNRKLVISLLIVLAISSFGMTYYIFFSASSNTNIVIKLIYFILNAFLIKTIYGQANVVIKDKPVLIFSKSEIEIYQNGKYVSFLWSLVVNCKVEKEADGVTHYLTIETAGEKIVINISWLEKSPVEIEKLLNMYKMK
ncbi:hypothetical protein [Flavihumibacter sp. CACIAM 22H1]|uniref:hypothetical protein n=1 Tax=Flavihumibacter sp. CACIAM 22H1 TaxID=1812911 RepID=UPI0007A92FDF|nr:hypothetical protein [Flavihumibacter sp. CACIAM 22H1]KYP13541.1 MAG: hypothetical protein A1D16_17425 [Flavihumibacter sp. CACIAM 22H1]